MRAGRILGIPARASRGSRDRKEWSLAQADLDRALALRPGLPELLFERARTERNTQKWEAAGADLLAGLRVEPANRDGRDLLADVMQGMIYEGWQHQQAGRREDALRVFDLAAELEPGSREVQWRRTSIVAGPQSPTEEMLQSSSSRRAGPAMIFARIRNSTMPGQRRASSSRWWSCGASFSHVTPKMLALTWNGAERTFIGISDQRRSPTRAVRANSD